MKRWEMYFADAFTVSAPQTGSHTVNGKTQTPGCTGTRKVRKQALRGEPTLSSAIFEAAVKVAKKGVKVIPEVMSPLIGGVKELDNQKQIVVAVANEVLAKAGMKDLKYMVGTMIEIPRAALTADLVATAAEFFSFGTNDLTQTGMGLSRDDYTKFQADYEKKKIFANDPFAVLDQEGVGKLVKMAVELGRKTNPKLEIGICGEHGGEPNSVQFCYRVGMNYVSCSPYRVPIARLAAAQAAISGDKSEAMRTA